MFQGILMKKCIICNSISVDENFKCKDCGFSPKKIDQIVSFLNVSDLSNEQFDPATYKEFAETEVKNFWYVSRPKLISIVIKKYLKDAHNFLEIGCGTGYVLYNMNKKLPNLELYGADVYVEGLEFVKKRLRGNIKLYQFDAKNIPFENHFDLIGAFDVLEHIDDDKSVLHELYKALKPGGIILLMVPQYMLLWSAWDEINRHKRRYSRGQLAKITEQVGFQIERDTSFVFFLFPFIYLKRLFEKGKKKVRPIEENNINYLVNKLFSAIMFFERILIMIGLRFPFGSSSLVVARKPYTDIKDNIDRKITRKNDE